MQVLFRFPEGMYREAVEALDAVRKLYPRVIFWIDPDPCFRKPKPGRPFIRRALFALQLPGEPTCDLSPVVYWFGVAHERFLWKRHALEVEAVKDRVADLCYEAARTRDRMLHDRSVK